MEGFSIFSAPHIITLLIIVLVSIGASCAYRRVPADKQDMIGLVMGIVIALMDIAHYFGYYYVGELSVNAIPLHLCAMAVYLCLLHSIFRTDWLGQVLYVLCLPGAWCALIFPDWAGTPFFSYPSLHSFIEHGLIVIYIIMQTASGRIKPRLSKIWKPVVFLCAAVPAAAIANGILGTNFMFINYPAPGSPLEFLAALAGGSHAVYLILFALLAFIVMTIMLLPFTLRRRR